MEEELPFKYVGGDPSLDLVNTIDWTDRGPIKERLTDYVRLTRWAEGAGVLSQTHAQALRRKATARPAEAKRAHEAALRLRDVLQRLYASVAAGKRSDPAWGELNEWLGEALRHLRVSPLRKGQAVAEWEWHGVEEILESVLWPVVWSAANLVTSDEARRIRLCGAPDCGWMYVDRSRNRLRRWCQMETCGTIEKSRRRAERARTV